MITQEMIPRIEKAFDFSLYVWQKDYLLGKRERISYVRKNGNTFAYILKLLLSDGKPIKINELTKCADGYHGPGYSMWFRDYCMKINDILLENGFQTRLQVKNGFS